MRVMQIGQLVASLADQLVARNPLTGWVIEWVDQGSDTRVRTQKNPVVFFEYTRLKNPPQKPTLLASTLT